LLYEAQELDAALEMYERALKVDPRDQESLKARKNLAAEGALRSTGIEQAKSSRELVKDRDAQRRIEKAQRLQLSKEEIDLELAALQDKLQADPDHVDTLVRAADLHAMDKDFEGALDHLERAARLAPERSDLAARAGELRLRIQEKRVTRARNKGDDAAAEQAEQVLREMRAAEYRRRVAQHPTDFALRYDLGVVLLESGEVDLAIAELQQAVKDPRKKGDAMALLGRAFWRKSMPEVAVGQLQKALEALGPSHARAQEIVYDLGCIAEELGRSEEALRHFSRILEQDIGYRDVAQKVEQLKSSKPS
jgi:tetratricopeptide (TPR) repeat protein